MNARLETAKSQPPLPPRDSNTLEGEIQSADFESRCSDLQQTNDELRKQLNSSQNQVQQCFKNRNPMFLSLYYMLFILVKVGMNLI